MAENGEEKLIAVARQIAKTLGGHTDTMTDDILKIFSNFDGRLRENFTDKLSGDDVEQIIIDLDRRISRYVAADRPIWSDSADLSSFLDSVDQLISAVRDWTPLADDKTISHSLDRAEDLIQQSMFRLEDEFKTLSERGAGSFGVSHSDLAHPDFSDEDEEEDEEYIPVAYPITDYDVVIDALPAGTIGDLHEIAKRMVAAGYAKECTHAYSTFRREFLEESFSRLGLQKLSIDDVHRMNSAHLEDEIEKWIKAMNVSLKILFPSERRLCDRVFSSAADLSFMEVCRFSTTQLLSFADAVAISSRAPDHLFKVLDVYETVRDLIPEFNLIFSDQHCVPLRNEAVAIQKRLGEAIRSIFMELQNLIRRDPARDASERLHPITRYVMNYIQAACRSRITLEQVFEESDNGGFLSSSSSLANQFTWIMELLESNLEAKSKVYRDSGLCSVFLMNNGRYILQKVKDNEVGMLLGEDWMRKHTAKLRQHHLNYQRSSWSKVLGVLKVDNSSNSMLLDGKRVKEKLKMFNSRFEEVCKAQSSWVIFDHELRDELRRSIAVSLVSAYGSFVVGIKESGLNVDRYIKYSAEDIEARIEGLFEVKR